MESMARTATRAAPVMRLDVSKERNEHGPYRSIPQSRVQAGGIMIVVTPVEMEQMSYRQALAET